MNYQKILKSSFLGKRNTNMATVAVIGGVAIGVAIGVLFTTKQGKKTKGKIIGFFSNLTGRSARLTSKDHLGKLIADVRGHIKQNAEGILGAERNRQQASAIHVDGVHTNKWKEQKEKVIFPNDPNPKTMYN